MYRYMKFKRTFIIFWITILIGFAVNAQQNHNMYLLHNIPESNLLNPAIPISCKWYIGLPVLSSVHFNYANSSLTYKQLFSKQADNTYRSDINGALKRLHRRNYIGTEIHLQLAALGYRKGDYSFMFTLTEKNNIPFIYPQKPVQLAWGGNTQFEGETAGFKGTGFYFNHYREYALSVSKYKSRGVYWGIRGKLIFGKLNVATRSTKINLFTDETSFALNFSGDLLAHTSLPVIVDTNGGGINSIAYDQNASITQLILNRKNPGFGIDLGIIYPYNDKVELSASIIDLGFIRWRSNLNTFKANGNFFYDGPLANADSLPDEQYLSNVTQAFSDSMQMEVSDTKYFSFLPTRILAGATYQLDMPLKLGLQSEAMFYRTKIIPSITASAIYSPWESIQLMASYSIQYYSLKSVGLGIVLGKNPVQFYILSDNVPGLIWPLSARNINLRFGLNINLGCKLRDKNSGGPGSGKGQLAGNCYWAEKQLKKKINRRRK